MGRFFAAAGLLCLLTLPALAALSAASFAEAFSAATFSRCRLYASRFWALLRSKSRPDLVVGCAPLGTIRGLDIICLPVRQGCRSYVER